MKRHEKTVWLVGGLAGTLVLSACSGSQAEPEAPTSEVAQANPEVASAPEAEESAPAESSGASAHATLKPTEGHQVAGTLTFTQVAGGVRLEGEISGLTPDSQHAIHVHETGDCSAPDGKSAGGHFNPEQHDHGRAGAGEHHLGDMDNLSADASGVATVERELQGATLGDGGPHDVVGRAVIVHAAKDDYTSQPAGDAGARIGCAVVEAP